MALHATVRSAAGKSTRGSVLLVEDDAPLARSITRVICAEGYEVVHAGGAAAALDMMESGSFDLVISDLNLGGASGVDVLNVVRAYDADVPLVLMTGRPTVDTAIEACSLGVLEYLVKPTPREELVRVLHRASMVRQSSRRRREARDSEQRSVGTADTVFASSVASEALAPPSKLPTRPAPASSDAGADGELLAHSNAPVSAPSSQDARFLLASFSAPFERALSTLEVELEPIADAKTKTLLGFAARMRSTDETLTTESALVVMATRLDRLAELRRRVRDLAVEAFASAPPDALLFVDVHPSDLLEGDIYSPEPPLACIADRVVLQVRARGLARADLSARASVLRFVGFRLSFADLDAGQECLAQLADLSPEFVKIDSRLVRGLDGSAGRRRLVGALVSMCRSLEAVPVAEGVSTAEEREALVKAGCDLVQGAVAARYVPPSSRRPALAKAGVER